MLPHEPKCKETKWLLRFELDNTFDAMDNARRMFADPRVKADVDAPDEPEPDADSDPDDNT